MQFRMLTLDEAPQACGTVVVIDVIRAFTTAAYAFAAGAREIHLVETVEEALARREALPGARVLGEVGGHKPPAFDFGNSPSEISNQELSGIRLVQRTTSGTPGMARVQHASLLLAASFVCAGATARYVRRLNPGRVDFILTGLRPDGLGDEDRACAEYLAALLNGSQPDPQPYLERVDHSLDAEKTRRELAYGAQDLPLCLALDRFSFALRARRRDGMLILKRVEAPR